MKYSLSASKPTFVDVFAGCGGLSLGLIQAGWNGVFAVEKSPEAFTTFHSNLIQGRVNGFDWPSWLPVGPISSTELLSKYDNKLAQLRGTIDLLAGGPPCQGFSLAGRRVHADPRNSLVSDYIGIVKALEPRLLLLENVRGFTLPFRKDTDNSSSPYSTRLQQTLVDLGYTVYSQLVDMSKFGIPQSRLRFILVGVRNDGHIDSISVKKTPFEMLDDCRLRFLIDRNLPLDRPVTAQEAIGDLEVAGKDLLSIDDECFGHRRFVQIKYEAGLYDSAFISLMRKGAVGTPNSLRLANHSEKTLSRFTQIRMTCKAGKSVTDKDRQRLGLKKHSITPLSPSDPAATITTLPDDIIHYAEPRILTVRENARLQTFPDWFEFSGPYTTGGKSRKHACPRYTQVGNAVPPLFAEALGKVLQVLLGFTDDGNPDHRVRANG